MSVNGAQIAVFGQAAAKMREALDAKGLNYADLGRHLKPQSKNPAAVVSEWLNAKRPVPERLQDKIANFLDLSPDDLLPSNATVAKKVKKVAAKKPGPKQRVMKVYGRAKQLPSAQANLAQAPSFLFEVIGDKARVRVDMLIALNKGVELFEALLKCHGGESVEEKENV
jgi:hypothetical protein